jgi:hypothetical protein
VSTFKLVVLPNGKSILAAQRAFDYHDTALIAAKFAEWYDSPSRQLLVLSDCDVVQVVDIRLDLADAPCQQEDVVIETDE